MALPIITAPKYELSIPSTGQVVSYRPFLVKEEKILLLANETKDQKQIIAAMSNIITNCTFGELEVKNLATFDIEYIFLQLRSKSVGEVVEVNVKCKKCESLIPLSININDVTVKKEDGISNNIIIYDNTGIFLRYPNFEALQKLETTASDGKKTEELINFIASCIEKIYDEKQVYDAKEHTQKELISFLESLPQKSFSKIMSFFNKMPHLYKSIETKCEKCGHEDIAEFRGAQDFFQSA